MEGCELSEWHGHAGLCSAVVCTRRDRSVHEHVVLEWVTPTIMLAHFRLSQSLQCACRLGWNGGVREDQRRPCAGGGRGQYRGET